MARPKVSPPTPHSTPHKTAQPRTGRGVAARMGTRCGTKMAAIRRGATIQAAKALNNPVDLKGPALDAAEGDEVCGGGKASDPVIEDADEGVCSHRWTRE